MATTQDQKKRLLRAKIAVAIQDETGRVPTTEQIDQVFFLSRVMWKAVLGLQMALNYPIDKQWVCASGTLAAATGTIAKGSAGMAEQALSRRSTTTTSKTLFEELKVFANIFCMTAYSSDLLSLIDGIRWGSLPHDYPAWQTAYWYFTLWAEDGTIVFLAVTGLMLKR